MKNVKSISLFIISPVICFMVGFLCGLYSLDLLYSNGQNAGQKGTETREEQNVTAQEPYETQSGGEKASEESEAAPTEEPRTQTVSRQPDTINADTEYVLEETDLTNGSVVETRWSIPEMYIGMDRETFLAAMEAYEANPPLSELERGFVSLEVLSFSEKQVRVQMNYKYVQPGESFYLMVYDGRVIVYQEDRQTIFLNPNIMLRDLPEDIQQEIIQGMLLPDQESLYSFLEDYTS